MNYFELSIKEPYRVFFPQGVLYLLWGILLWLPQIWNPGDYPVLAHRYLVLNGFTASFIAGFLMTAVPKFSQTAPARVSEVLIFGSVTLFGIVLAYLDFEREVFLISSAQSLILLTFILLRIVKRQANPPYSFIFIFTGLLLWLLSGVLSAFMDLEIFKSLHYEGAIASIILGVGGRLIPEILGHIEVVSTQRQKYEVRKSLISTIPIAFLVMVLGFMFSYFIYDLYANSIRAFVVSIVAWFYWRIGKRPFEKTSLTWSIWLSAWMITLSFVLKAFWVDGLIHASHSFFINGIVLLSLLISIRVIQSHGPKIKALENKKIIYVITSLVVLAGTTRVSAFLLPETYLRHLGYSALILALAVVIWGVTYLKYVLVSDRS